MRSIKILVLVIVIFLVVLAYSIYSDVVGYSHSFPVNSDFKFTEANAIDLSGRALNQSGIDVAQYVPIPWGPPDSTSTEKLFARNTLNPNNGYVRWATKVEERPLRGYSVRLDYKQSEVIAKVTKFK